MAAVPGARCAEIACTLDEPMVGTAPSTRRWLCLERTEPWAAHINHDRDPDEKLMRAVEEKVSPTVAESAKDAFRQGVLMRIGIAMRIRAPTTAPALVFAP